MIDWSEFEGRDIDPFRVPFEWMLERLEDGEEPREPDLRMLVTQLCGASMMGQKGKVRLQSEAFGELHAAVPADAEWSRSWDGRLSTACLVATVLSVFVTVGMRDW